MDKIKTAAYCRVSTDKETQDGSYELQESYFTELISADPHMELVGIYGDKGKSGLYADKRPGLQKLMDDCRAGKINLILTKSISRFARNMAECAEMIRELRSLGVNIIFEEQNLNSQDTKCDLVLNIFAAIAEEESHIRSYLEIQQFRYRDMLTYDIDIDPECRECMILKMTLQPVVENAIYHGIKNKRGGGHISIRIQRDGGRIKMLVSDTGIGMTEEQLTELVRRVDGLEAAGMGDEHFGLANVSERLRLNYGEAAGMVFRSEYGEGTEVEIYIPYSVNI